MGNKQSAYTIKLLSILGIGVLILAIGLFGWNQLNLRYTNLDHQRTAKLNELDAIQQETKQQHKYEEEDAALTAQLSTIDTELKDYQFAPSFVEQLKASAKRTDNVITHMQQGELRAIDLQRGPLAAPAPTPDGKNPNIGQPPPPANAPAVTKPGELGYQVRPIDLEVRGSFVSLMRLLADLRRFPKLVYIRTLTISPQHSSEDPAGLITTHLQTYIVITPEQYKHASPDAAPEPAAAQGGTR